MSDIILRTEGLSKAYALPKGELRVFENIDFELERGDLVAIMGVSGVGKTTLLNLLGALDRPTEGRSGSTARTSGRSRRPGSRP